MKVMKVQNNNTLTDTLLDEMYQSCTVELNEAIQVAVRFAAAELLDKLEKVDDSLQTDFSIAINLLESNQEWLGSQVCDGVLKKLKNTQNKIFPDKPTKTVTKPSVDLNSLSLVEKGEFEGWLIADTGVKFLERELSSELFKAIQITSHLVGNQLDHKSYMVGPKSIFIELKRTIDTIELPQTAQAIFYKSTSKSLVSDLKDIYKKIEHMATKAGMNYAKEQPLQPNSISASPKVTAGQHQNDFPQTTNDLGSANPQNSVGMELPGSNNQPRQMKTLNTLARLQTSVSTGGSLNENISSEAKVSTENQTQPSNNTQECDSSQLITAISQLQQSQGNTPSTSQRRLRNWIETSLDPSLMEGRSIGAQNSELIDVIDRFFDVIYEKIGVSGLLESWLEKLKLTILKIVIRDESFFSDVSHPARLMLNKLAKLAADNHSGSKRLEKLLDQYVNRVVTEYDQDESVIEIVVQELDKLIDRQKLACRRNSERIARTYEGKQKIADARYKVIEDLNLILEGKSVPLIILDLLDKAGWRELLTLAVLREGFNSETYNEMLNVVKQLMNWLGLSTSPEIIEQRALELELEATSLLEMVSKELSVVGSSSFNVVLKRLEDCLCNDAPPVLVEVDKYKWDFDKSEKDLENFKRHVSVSGNEQKTHWYKRITSMKIGDWIELKDDGGSTRCLRLAWSGTESFRFLFVDSQGMKDEDISLKELLDAFENNLASFVTSDEVSLVDQGLHQMVQSVYEDLSSQANCDQLTGLLNRQSFVRALEQSITGGISHKTQTAMLYIDLDNFNLTNTNYGHEAGDSILKNVAQITRETGKDNTFCGRLGGNEFGLIIPECDLEQAKEIAGNIREKVENEPYQWEDHKIICTISVGVVSINLETDCYDSVMRKARLACDSAKTQGHNRFIVYEEQDKDQKRRNEILQWVQRLDGSLDDLLTLRCQEIRPINEKKQSFSHYEILLGVHHEGQVLPPGTLIEAAEHFDRMAKVDRWVIHNALGWMDDNQSTIEKVDGFSINLSGNSLNDDTFLEFVLGELSAASVSSKKICFEITETAAITNLADTVEFIRVIKETGCKFSLDDFGSGLSSFAYIQKLPVDTIKIDGIFVRNLVTSMEDQALVKSINELAHFMGMKTVAEYVENHEILEELRAIGVDHSQGYGIKKPGLLADLSL